MNNLIVYKDGIMKFYNGQTKGMKRAGIPVFTPLKTVKKIQVYLSGYANFIIMK